MAEHARIVIIGGGIIGCSTAYHLTKLGCRDVVLLEKGELTSGSTWHAAGLVGQLRSERNITRMLQYSVSLYERLEQETGLATGWKPCGCLHLASTKERMYELRRGATTARSFGLEMHMLSPREALDRCPILSPAGLVGAAYMPTDGQADPAGITQALARGAREGGAQIRRFTRVTGFERVGNRITHVRTDQGELTCEAVVNCTGMWGYRVGEMLGVNTPVVPFQHQYLVSGPIEGLPRDLPTLRDKDNLIYYKEEVGGLVMGGYERNGIPWSVHGVSDDFTAELLAPDYDHFMQLAEPAMERTPCLREAGIARLINGPEAFTPDGYAVMGPAPEMENVFVAVGFNAYGIAAGGGAGRMMAEWILAGEPSLDIWPLDIRRLGPHHRSRAYNVERTREMYGKHYTIHWPNEENASARGLRRSPLYAALREKGAVFGVKYGWERPNWFAPAGVEPRDEPTFEVPGWFHHVGAEHAAAREGVVLIDQSSFAKFEVAGPGALAFLDRLATNHVNRPVGAVTYTQLCNARGTIECDLTIARTGEDRFLLVTGTAFWLHDSLWVRRHMPTDGSVSFHDLTPALAVINVAGPRSRDLLRRVCGDDLSNEAFPFSACRPLTVGHAPVTALRLTYLGELGYELYVPTEFACHVYETLWEAGGPLGVRNAGYRAIHSLHLEKGYAAWGTELTPEYTPYDARLGFCVALDKGDFLGREALEAARRAGPRWSLCTFTIDGPDPVMARGSEPILQGDAVMGVTTTGGYGYTVGKTIAYGYLPADGVGDGPYAIEVYGKIHAARREAVRALYDPHRERILAAGTSD